MKSPISSFQARWLLESDQPGISTPLALNGTPWQTYAFPNQQGTGGYEILELAMGMSVFRGEHRFNAQSFGRMIALAEFEVQFSEPTFMVQMARGGRIMHKEQIPLIDLVYSPGNDLFRYTQHIKQTPWLDASSDSDMFALSIGTSMLITLLGEDLGEKLIGRRRRRRFLSAHALGDASLHREQHNADQQRRDDEAVHYDALRESHDARRRGAGGRGAITRRAAWPHGDHTPG